MRKALLAAVVCASLAAASCATSYGPRYERAADNGDTGYYDTRVSENRFIVQYRAAGGDAQLGEDFAFRRAAELALEEDYDWFQVINRSRGLSDGAFDRFDRARVYRDQYQARPSYRDDYARNYGYYDERLIVLEIIMGYNPAPRGDSIYDARRVLDDLRY